MNRDTEDVKEDSVGSVRATSLGRRLLLCLCSVAVCLAIGEGLLRIAEKGRTDTTFDRPFIYGAIGYNRLHPWSQGTNAALRIAVLGDSITMGSGVQPADTYGMRLEQLLNVNDGVAPAEVRVYAQAGANTSDELRFLSEALAAVAAGAGMIFLAALGVVAWDAWGLGKGQTLVVFRLDDYSPWFPLSLGHSLIEAGGLCPALAWLGSGDAGCDADRGPSGSVGAARAGGLGVRTAFGAEGVTLSACVRRSRER